MPVFTIQAPDGRKIKIEAADQATALRGAQEWARANPPKRKTATGAVGDVVARGMRGPTNPLAEMFGNAVDRGARMAMQAGASLVGGSPQGPSATGVMQFGRGVVDSGQGVLDAVAAAIPGANALARVGRAVTDTILPAAKPTNALEQGLRTAGQMTANALLPGSAAQRVRNVVGPTIGAEIAGNAASAMGAGEGGQNVARVVGGAVGGAVANAKVTPRNQRHPAQRGARRVGGDTTEMRARAEQYRSHGIDPTLVDVTDEAGRSVVRAAASRQTPGRQAAQDFAESRAMNLPDRMGNQARRIMSPDPRTPLEIADDLGRQRAQQASQQFGAVRGELIQLAPEGVQALRTDLGRAAIREAAARERDPLVRAALNRLAEDALDAPSTPITVGMADRVSRVLAGKAGAAARAGDNDLAATYTSLSKSIREPARQAVPGYDAALKGFEAQSKLMSAAERGEDFLARNTDEFAASLEGATPEELALARATGRRAIERAAGENISAAPGVARRIALAPEQQARNRALLGDQGANQLQEAMRLEGQAVSNARFVAPNTGSQTQLRAADAASQALTTGSQIVRQDWIGLVQNWLKSRGLSDREAQALVEMAIDPNRLDEALMLIEQRAGPGSAQQLLQSMRQGGILAGPAVVASQQEQ
jgi:hypothetical protein